MWWVLQCGGGGRRKRKRLGPAKVCSGNRGMSVILREDSLQKVRKHTFRFRVCRKQDVIAPTFRTATAGQALLPGPPYLKEYKLLGAELVGGEYLGKPWNMKEVRRGTGCLTSSSTDDNLESGP